MRRIAFLFFLILIALSGFSGRAEAGLFFCNHAGQPIEMAIGFAEDSGTWSSKGWFQFDVNECKGLLFGPLRGRYYYYFARSTEGRSLVWKEGPGGAHFCTAEKAFYFDRPNDNCEGFIFSRRDVEDAEQYTIILAESEKYPTKAALDCRDQMSSGINDFTKCWIRGMATDKQNRILDCVNNSTSKSSLAICANRDSISPELYKVATCSDAYNTSKRGDIFLACIANGSLSEDQARVFQCAVNNRENLSAAGSCALTGQLTPEQRRIFECVANNRNNYVDFGMCAAAGQLNPEQRRIANCVLTNRGNYVQMGFCAGGNRLTPEQQVFASCAITTGGQPYAFAGCVGTQLTLNELQKCLTSGIGGSGCYGDNNTAVAFTRNAWKDVTQGPGPSNELLGKDGFIGRVAGGPNSVVNHPGQILGGPNSVPNQILRNVPSPPPIELPPVAGHRVCIPWC
jgi:uncharacterized membrane protein